MPTLFPYTTLFRSLAARLDDLGGTELTRQLLAGGVAAERDDALSPESGGCKHARQADRPVADNGDDATRLGTLAAASSTSPPSAAQP